MARRTSNRDVRITLWVPIAGYADCFKISNRRWQVYSANYPHAWQHVKPSRKQKDRQRQHVQQITSYDPGNGEEKAVECVFRRDLATGALTLMSSDIVERKVGDRPMLTIDEWPWL